MWKLTKRFTFEAAHKLPHHDGKCKRLHGHSFGVVVQLRGVKLQETGPKQGMLVDFSDVKRAMKPLLEEYLDHHYLNESLQMESPTSELLAQWLYERLKIRLPRLYSVMVEETCTCSCTYNGQEPTGEGAKELAAKVAVRIKNGQVGQ